MTQALMTRFFTLVCTWCIAFNQGVLARNNQYTWRYDAKNADTSGLFGENKLSLNVIVKEGVSDAPLFLYFPGTTMRWDGQPALTMLNWMAGSDFVAIGVQYPLYDNWDSKYCRPDVKGQLMANTDVENSLINLVCSKQSQLVNCDKGIAVMGYSQGGQIAHEFAMALNRREGVSWKVTGLVSLFSGHVTDSNVSPFLPRSRRRYFNGGNDTFYGNDYAGALEIVKRASGYDCGESDKCIQEDNSGYQIYAAQTHTSWIKGGALPFVGRQGVVSWFMTPLGNGMNWLATTARTPLALDSGTTATTTQGEVCAQTCTVAPTNCAELLQITTNNGCATDCSVGAIKDEALKLKCDWAEWTAAEDRFWTTTTAPVTTAAAPVTTAAPAKSGAPPAVQPTAVTKPAESHAESHRRTKEGQLLTGAFLCIVAIMATASWQA